MKNIVILASVVAAVILSGCATTPQRQRYRVSVNGLAAQTTNAPVSFVILPGDKDVRATELQFQEYAGFVERALSQRGFHRDSAINFSKTIHERTTARNPGKQAGYASQAFRAAFFRQGQVAGTVARTQSLDCLQSAETARGGYQQGYAALNSHLIPAAD
ncbi:MAG: hypothetical protein FJ398_05855 [Verrucomicrobia bacterium]|nr:hypothetical protein [Verrucomicrobiota bacterium]